MDVDGVFLQQPTEKAKASLTKFGIAMNHKLLHDLQLPGANCVVGWGRRSVMNITCQERTRMP